MEAERQPAVASTATHHLKYMATAVKLKHQCRSHHYAINGDAYYLLSVWPPRRRNMMGALRRLCSVFALLII